MNNRPNALFLTPRYPFTLSGGGLIVTQERLRVLSESFNVTVLTLEDGSASPQIDATRWRQAGRLRPRTPFTLAKSFASGIPISVYRNCVPDFLALVDQYSQQQFDLLYTDHWLMIPAAQRLRATHSVLHLHNAEHLLFERAAKNLSAPKALIATMEGKRALRFLQAWLPTFDEIHFLSRDDFQAIEAGCGPIPQAQVFLPAVTAPEASVPSWAERSALIFFVGSLSWYPNDEGLQWFWKKVWPHFPEHRDMKVVGAGASSALAAIARTLPGVHMQGFVEDIEPYFRKARTFVAPLISGSGIKIKIIEALARGIPTVTTSMGAEGLPDALDSGLAVADSPQGFAQAIDAFLNDEHLWAQASDQGRAYARRHLSGSLFKAWVSNTARSLSLPH